MAASSGSAEGTRNRRRDGSLVAIGIVAVLLIWFAIGNSQDVRIHFWVTSAHAPLWVVIVVAGVMGALIAMLVSRRRSRR